MPEQVRATIIDPEGKEYSRWTVKGKTVWEAMELMGWDTGGACGGQGTCGKCKFRLTGGISALSTREREHLIPEEIKNGHRMACLAVIEGDFTLYIDYWTNEGAAKQNLLKYQPFVPSDSPVTNKNFYIAGREQDSHTPVYDRIKRALPDYYLQLNMANINELAVSDRPGRPTLELHAVVFDEKKILQVGRQREKIYGLALDIGTTSLFAALLDMESGEVAAMASHSNMQRIYGEDIIARVNFAVERADGTSILQRILINNLNSMIEEMLQESGASSPNIYRVTAVGNPVMLHLLLGLNVAQMGRAPYIGLFAENIETSAVQLGLQVNPLSPICLLPQLGGFVGADTTACLLTLSSVEQGTYLLIDIGTNGEIVLSHQGKMWAASAAAGPAFEGGAISCGLRAGPGAIDKVTVNDGAMDFRVIGGGPPRGICGSGIIDLISVLLQYQGLDRNGNIMEPPGLRYRIRSGERSLELILVEEDKLLNTSPLVFSQEDIRQFQLARSAIRTAIEILLKKAGIDAKQLQKIYLAGAFGSYLDPVSVLNIGLIPGMDKDKIQNIGNAAAEGAIMALVSKRKFNETSSIKARVQCVELAEQAEFQELFLKNINF